MRGRTANKTNGEIAIPRSLINRINSDFVLVWATLSNSSCIFSSMISDTFPAPALAASIAAPTATEVSRPAGLNFRIFNARRPHIFALRLPTREAASIAVVSSPSSVSFFENRLKNRRVLIPTSAIFFNLSTSYRSTDINILRTRRILNASKTIHKEKNAKRIRNPRKPASPHVLQPIGSNFILKRMTVSGGKTNARDSLRTNTDSPLIGSSRNCRIAQPLCGANFLMTRYNGLVNNKVLNKNGNQINTRTYNSQGPSGGKDGICSGSDTIVHPPVLHE